MGPTVIIGLGGVGSEIVAMLKNFSDTDVEIRQMLRLAILDTDVNALRERQRDGFDGTVIQISDNMTVEKYLAYDDKADEWYPTCEAIKQKTLTEGAGQIRVVSRLALNMALEKGKLRPLYNAIDELHLLQAINSEQATRVIIVTSLAGGTGSGVFLPLAMHLRDYLKRAYRNTEPIVKGFFVMPSMFDYVASSEIERDSLHANGYAAIRELNAFMRMRQSANDRKRYKDLKVVLCGRRKEKEKYTQSPYDFCFLFEKQNMDDKHLQSFEESKRNVADCIYMQALSPTTAQNDSLEDNLFKMTFSQESSRVERFAGMGIARLEYPYQRLSEYLSIVLAQTVIQDNWAKADLDWERSLRPTEERGSPVSINLAEHYIKVAETSEDAWAEKIQKVQEEEWVKTYYDAVSKQCEDEMTKEVSLRYSTLIEEIQHIKTKKNAKLFQASKLTNLRADIMKGSIKSRLKIKNILFQILRPTDTQNFKPSYHHLQYWILQGGDTRSGCSPVEARYFLFQLQQFLSNCIQQDLNKHLTNRQRDKISGDQFAQAISSYKKVAKRARRRLGSIFLTKAKVCRCAEEIERVVVRDKEQEIWELRRAVLMELLEWVKNVSETYTSLVQDFTRIVGESTKRRREDLQNEFDHPEGSTVRLVCASRKCLERMEAIVRSQVWTEREDDTFSKYLGTMAISQAERKRHNEVDLERYWYDRYMQNDTCRRLLNVNILHALENEARWILGLDERDTDYAAQVALYITRVMQTTREIFSRAFVRIPDVSQRHMLAMNFYPEELKQEKGFLLQLARQELMTAHGYAIPQKGDAEERSRYTITFYRALFGVSASEVSPFLCERADSPYSPGESFLAYKRTMQNLEIDNGNSNIFTPHLDRHWHSILAMPELSDEYGKYYICKITAAVLYCYAAENIKDDKLTIDREVRFSKQPLSPGDIFGYFDRNPRILHLLWNEKHTVKREIIEDREEVGKLREWMEEWRLDAEDIVETAMQMLVVESEQEG